MANAIGQYEIRGELGRGAMAVVWRAWDTRLEREVALKEPLLPHGIDPAMREELAERFVREGKAAARLNHPGIVTIFNAEIIDDRPVIAMELISGATLSSLIDKGPLAVEQAVVALDQLLDAVGYAHARGVVHRDIKPDNVFVTDDGRVKLADFGIAHIEEQSNFTQAGTLLGTPGYMSPEQVTGVQIDSRSDLFSVGVVAYEMLVGRDPFGSADGANATAVLYRIVHEDPPEISAGAAGIPGHVSEAVRIALAKDPDFRFPSAEAMREALRGGEMVVGPGRHPAPEARTSIPPLAARTPAGHSSRGPWVYAAVTALGILVTAVLVIVATSGGPRGSGVPVASDAPVDSGDGADSQAVPAAESQSEATPDPTPEELQISLEESFSRWRTVWSDLDFGTYIAFYARDFQGEQHPMSGNSRYRGYSDWSAWKADVFAARRIQTVEVHDMTVDVRDKMGHITFIQFFAQDSTSPGGLYRDSGVKEMVWEWRDGEWLIVREDWTEAYAD